MNKIYKVIWSKVKHQYVVVSELAHSNGKQSRTSRNSIRSRIAALVVCGAIAAFGVFSAVPNSAYAATAAETTSGQYIAVALADTNEEDVAGQWYNQNSTKFGNDYEWNSLWGKWVECDNTRTFKDATGALHTYTKQTINNKTYWVREGYSISAEEGNRFTAYDEHKKPIAPENTYIIDSQKSNGADDVGLISSSQVVISDDSKHTTLTGNPLNNIEPGIYGGASNGGGTEVPVDYHYYIDNNGKGWVNIGKQDWDNFTNPSSGKGYFQEVYAQKDGSYNTKEDGSGISVSSEYLYAIDKTSTGSSDKSDVKLGAFFNSNGTLYTGNVYGNNNEVLMTGVENGTYYSYWGTKINDLNTSLSEMTVGDLNRIVGGINDTIYTAQGDDIKQVSVQKSQDNNGGTIDLIRRGDWNGTAYEETDPIPGTITIKNPTTDSGTNGNDVKIRFGSIDEDGTTDVEKFTVDAGSKVVGKITTENGVEEAGVGDANKTLTGLKINGVDYALSQGKTYGNGDGISIDETTNKISVALAKEGDQNVSGLHFENGGLVNDLQVTNVDTATTSELHNDGGNWTITKTDEKGTSVDLTNTTLSSSVTSDPESEVNNEETEESKKVVYGKDYTISDTDGNTATIEDVASADTLKTIDTTKIGDLKYNDFTEGDSDATSIVQNDEDLTTAVGKLDNAVSEAKTEAGKHTKMTVNGGDISPIPENGTESAYTNGNLQIKQTVENGQTTYDIKLNPDVTLDGNTPDRLKIQALILAVME